MLLRIAQSIGKFFRGRRALFLAVGLCLAVTGCANLNLCGDRPSDPALEAARRYRRPAAKTTLSDFSGVSNEAQQIEKNLSGTIR